jgi:hypothetical protein
MDDELFKSALGHDSDEYDTALPSEPVAEPSRATQNLQSSGLDSDEEGNADAQPTKPDGTIEELPQKSSHSAPGPSKAAKEVKSA